MPPLVPALCPLDLVSCPLQHKDLLNQRALREGSVHDSLGCDALPSSPSLVASDENTGFAVLYTVTKRLGGETGEDDRVDGTDTCTCKEGGDGVPGHGKIDRDGIALFDAVFLQDIGDAANFTQELSVGDESPFAWLVGLVDDSGL